MAAMPLTMTGYLTARARFSIQGIGILNVRGLAALAHRQIQLVVSGNVLQKVPGPLETEFRHPMQQQVSLEGATHAVAVFHARPRPAGMNPIRCIDPEQQTCTEKRD